MSKSIVDVIHEIINDPIVILIITTLAVLYTSTVGPTPPDYIRQLFKQPAFKFIVIFAAAYLACARKPIIGLISAISFLYLSSLIAKNEAEQKHN